MAFSKAGKRSFNDRGSSRSFGSGGRGGSRSGERSGGGRSFGGGAGRSGPLTLFDVTCAQCGKATQVPFKPTGERPVLCRDCFKGGDSGPRDSAPRRSYSAPSGPSADDIREINEKLDKIMQALDIE